jgi:hypothetical protein
MKKAFLSVAVVAVTSSMLHSAFACGFDREANREGSIIVLDCGGSGCVFAPPRDPFAPLIEPPDPSQACGSAYFDPNIYTGTNGLVVWEIAGIGVQSQYRSGAGFAPSLMDANARLIDGDE